ncbi:MAG: Gldg family protein [Planctomycetaceae bacterium]|nr:Gldg family protein [Planctomycetaceae bacterium]
MIRLHAVFAIARRNFSSYFSGILGYLFITVFCVASSVAAFLPSFFAANQANLDQLSAWFPLLLLFMIPAITMSTWADERKNGTDELLFTLPTTESEALLGKYLAVAAVYSVALAFSMINVLILEFVGSPDYGLTIGVYFGYWVAGLALLSAGMLASALTSNNTVAFVVGVVFCGIPVIGHRAVDLLESICGIVSPGADLSGLRSFLQYLSLPEQLRDFGLGVISLSGIVYLIGFTLVMLYLNAAAISRRRWVAHPGTMAAHFSLRAVSVLAVAVSLLVLSVRYPVRADLTAEQQFTLSSATHDVLKTARSGGVTIQAFLSQNVPGEFTEIRRQLEGLLREVQASGGIDVQVTAVEPFSNEAEAARAMGIEPARVSYFNDGKREEADLFLGLQVHGPAGDATIPFFDRGVPIEYEIIQAIRSVMNERKLRIGILLTELGVTGGPSGNPMQPAQEEWEIVRELRKQYNVVFVNPAMPILVEKTTSADTQQKADGEEAKAEKPEDATGAVADGKKSPCDVLIAFMPSSLTDPEMDNFVEYVKSGRPVLIFDDPFPISAWQRGMRIAPRLPKHNPNAMMGQRAPTEPKADEGRATRLLEALDINWNYESVVFDMLNPHHEWSQMPKEYLFISGSANPVDAFNRESPVTKSLQEVVSIYSGSISHRERRDGQQFTDLLNTGKRSGTLAWDDFLEERFSMFGQPETALKDPAEIVHTLDDKSHTLAAHIVNTSSEHPLNAIFCADVDLVSDIFFDLRRTRGAGVDFDNVTFVLNCVDVLAKDEQFVELRSRRPARRTLEYVEQQTSALQQNVSKVEETAREELEKKIKEAQEVQDKTIADLESQADLDESSRRVQLQQKRAELTRKLERQREELEDDLNGQIRKAGLEMRQEIRRVERRVQLFAWIVPAVLPICCGMLFLGLRRLAESSMVNPSRRR